MPAPPSAIWSRRNGWLFPQKIRWGDAGELFEEAGEVVREFEAKEDTPAQRQEKRRALEMLPGLSRTTTPTTRHPAATTSAAATPMMAGTSSAAKVF